MSIRKILCFFSLFLFFIGRGYSNDEKINGTWKFDKVSSVDIFGEHNPDVVSNIKILYEQTEIKLDGSIVTIKKPHLKQGENCSIEYRGIKKTPLLYFHSDTTVAMYKKLFSHEDIELASQLYVFIANQQPETCSSIYSEIIKNDNYLVVVDRYYAVFFKKANTGQPVKKDDGDAFLDYCKDAKKNKTFDGEDKYICIFDKKNINEAYDKIKEMSIIDGIIREPLSKDNLKYTIDDGMVSYQWESPELLKLTISNGNETAVYEFQQRKSGTQVVITVDTGY